MAITKLQRLIREHGIKQSVLARECGLSEGAFSDLVRKGQWPKCSVRNSEIRHTLGEALIRFGANTVGNKRAFIESIYKISQLPKKKAQSSATTDSSEPFNAALKTAASTATTGAGAKVNHLGIDMLLRRQALSQAARKQFCPDACPFSDDVQEAADVFKTPDVRYVQAAMKATAKHGGILAVVGESGAGKSTLRREFIDGLQRESSRTVVIEPYVLAMEESDKKGKTLKAAHMAEAIITAVAPLTALKRSPEARFKQLHQLLQSSTRNGNKHVLIIEEAHCMPTATLKHLKRFFELEDGFKKLLAIILIGQPELRNKLSVHEAEVREVVQRCEMAELAPLGTNLQTYLEFKFKRVGAKLDEVLDKSAVEALAARLTYSNHSGNVQQAKRSFGGTATHSYVYPLAVANLLMAAMNDAAELGAPKVTAELIKGVRA
jgi:type II secretory pathway predicted ATPase ExeA